MLIIEDKIFDEERSLYGLKGVKVSRCLFSGPADGESPLKECSDIEVDNCKFELRYPFWHVDGGAISNTILTETCRAALWYDNDILISNSTLGGIKALRECENIRIEDSSASSEEFAWRCKGLDIKNFEITMSEYPFFECSDIKADNLTMKGKYSFQYVRDAVITNSNLDTKDAFWHTENVTVIDSVIKGEYLAWYSKNLHLIRCKIIGTQPLCYAEGLILEDCEMIDCDLSFEKSDVNATVVSSITSVKNPKSGSITAKSIGEIILDENTDCKIGTF